MSKPKWEKEMEEYINGMTAEEFRDFLQDTGYEFYKNVKTSFLGLIGLESSKEVSLPCYIRPDNSFQSISGVNSIKHPRH